MKPSDIFKIEKKHMCVIWKENLCDSIDYGDNYYRFLDLMNFMKELDKRFIDREEFNNKLEKLKTQIAQLPNRDDWLQKDLPLKMGVLDGGGVGKFKVIELIDKKIEEMRK